MTPTQLSETPLSLREEIGMLGTEHRTHALTRRSSLLPDVRHAVLLSSSLNLLSLSQADALYIVL